MIKKSVLFLAIVGFSVMANLHAQEKVKVKVNLTDFEGQPLANELMVFENTQKDEVIKKTTDKEGQFELKLPKGSKYDVTYKALNKDIDYDPLSIPDQKGRFILTRTFRYQEAEKEVYELKNVYFDTDKATLRPASYDALDNLINFLKRKSQIRIEVAGHTDNVGEAEYNRKLSQRRAESVKQYLVKNGVDANRIEAKGYGESDPVASNESEAGRQQNRRTEVRILNQ